MAIFIFSTLFPFDFLSHLCSSLSLSFSLFLPNQFLFYVLSLLFPRFPSYAPFLPFFILSLPFFQHSIVNVLLETVHHHEKAYTKK